jgi:type IV pilus assembly protein PilM
MGLPFAGKKTRKQRQHVVAVDLGGRTTKAVSIHRRGDGFTLNGFVVMDAPVSEQAASSDLISEHLKALTQGLTGRCKPMSLAIGVNDSVVRHTEMPLMATDDLRLVLKNNSRTYLQQDYSGHAFDCHVVPPKQGEAESAKPAKGKSGGVQKHKVLAAGAREKLLEALQTAVKSAGFVPDTVVPNIIGPVNAFEMALPEVFRTDAVALIDIGFRCSTISLVNEGEIIMTRVLHLGGDGLTNELAETLGITYAEAEGIKVGMPQEIQPQLEALVGPLGREIRASLDFYEHQYDRPVSAVYVSGGSARSEMILDILKTELMVDCLSWNPTGFLEVKAPATQVAELEQVAPQLAVAVGTAMATL